MLAPQPVQNKGVEYSETGIAVTSAAKPLSMARSLRKEHLTGAPA